MKRFKLCILLFMTVLGIMAENTNYLVVKMKSGDQVIFTCNESPKISFENGVMYISTESYQVTNVQKYFFTDDLTAIAEVKDDSKSNSLMVLDGGDIAIRLKDASVPVKICNVKGIAVDAKYSITDDNLLTIDMSGLEPDVYVLSIGNESIKLMKK